MRRVALAAIAAVYLASIAHAEEPPKAPPLRSSDDAKTASRIVEFTEEEAKLAVGLLELVVKAHGFQYDREARAIAEKIFGGKPKAAGPPPAE